MKAVLIAFFLCISGPATACQLALALTIDVSGSIDPDEYALQMNGLAQALEDPTVADALVAAKAKLLVMQWSGTSRQQISLNWQAMNRLSDVEKLARDVRSLPRAWRNFSTAIGDALLKAGNSFADVAHCKRRVVDVSGDGISNEGFSVEAARTALVARGIIINGLAIESTQQGLRNYFKESVIGGHGSFALKAEGYADYPRAIRRKLLEEITKPVG